MVRSSPVLSYYFLLFFECLCHNLYIPLLLEYQKSDARTGKLLLTAIIIISKNNTFFNDQVTKMKCSVKCWCDVWYRSCCVLWVGYKYGEGGGKGVWFTGGARRGVK